MQLHPRLKQAAVFLSLVMFQTRFYFGGPINTCEKAAWQQQQPHFPLLLQRRVN